MSDRPSTFGGTWTRYDRSGMVRSRRSDVGRSAREVQDRASYDHGPAAGASCLLILAFPTAGLLLAALLHTTGVTA
ncbi:hypothetical protein OG978_32375 [Streptomyces sp. NBC_01591]|uniref:hypothetical protein n=1 Tax=Streptomyces sp. NBC_01591 TaxID=2975888 RepID=UPI002DD82782|nr:hypothetical protein [Streptomyces sp. NBC_01591]WSD71670.1 hypothetical protein OG978_32375 [Streptomyces sp. NBC_01591]